MQASDYMSLPSLMSCKSGGLDHISPCEFFKHCDLLQNRIVYMHSYSSIDIAQSCASNEAPDHLTGKVPKISSLAPRTGVWPRQRKQPFNHFTERIFQALSVSPYRIYIIGMPIRDRREEILSFG